MNEGISLLIANFSLDGFDFEICPVTAGHSVGEVRRKGELIHGEYGHSMLETASDLIEAAMRTPEPENDGDEEAELCEYCGGNLPLGRFVVGSSDTNPTKLSFCSIKCRDSHLENQPVSYADHKHDQYEAE